MDIPTYLINQGQEQFIEALTQTLRQGVSDNGFNIPNLTTAQIALVAPDMAVGTLWFNSDLKKLQVMTDIVLGVPVIETITSV